MKITRMTIMMMLMTMMIWLGFSPCFALEEGQAAHQDDKAAKATIKKMEEETLMQTVFSKVQEAKDAGKSETEVDTKGFDLATVRATLRDLEKRHFFVDYYIPHDLYVKWS